MTDYNATITLARRPFRDDDDPWVGDVLDALVGYSPVVAGDNLHSEIIITLPATDVRQAATTALALTAQAAPGVRVVGLEILTTEEFDRRVELPIIPRLVSAAEAADRLGITRQAVLHRLEAGTLRGEKVGSTWVILEASLPRG